MNVIGASGSSVRKRVCDTLSIAVLPSLFLLFATASILALYRVGTPVYAVALLTALALAILLLIRRSCVRCRRSAALGEQLDAIMRSLTTEGIVLLDGQRRITACNDAVMTIFGRPAEQLIGHTSETLYDDRSGGVKGGVAAALQEQGHHLGRATGRRADGTAIPLEISTFLYRGGAGAVLVVRDITARLRVEQELEKARRDAEAALVRLRELESLRDSLAHMVVHDMRTPLQILLANSQLLSRFHAGELEGEARENLGDVIAQTRVLMQMAQAVLDVGRMESGQMPIERQRLDLGDAAAQLLDGMAVLTRYHRVTLERDAGVWVSADPDILQRVLGNLLMNALKYTPHGGAIHLRTRVRAGGGGRFEIADEGPGIAPDDQAHLFSKYPRVQHAVGGRQHSTGLGLAFCRLAIEAHGGRIGLESDGAKGSTFWFELPS